jgi:hypothetical protein
MALSRRLRGPEGIFDFLMVVSAGIHSKAFLVSGDFYPLPPPNDWVSTN